MIAHHDKCEIHGGQELCRYACAHNSKNFSGLQKINQSEIQEKIFPIDPKCACKPKTQVKFFFHLGRQVPFSAGDENIGILDTMSP